MKETSNDTLRSTLSDALMLLESGEVLKRLLLTSITPQTTSEADAVVSLVRHCCSTMLGERPYSKDTVGQRLSISDLTKEVKIHEFGHGYRDQQVTLRPESKNNRSVSEESFAYASEVGYAPRLDSVLFDLIKAQYQSTSYEPHIQAKRLVWGEMLKLLQQNPQRYGINGAILGQAGAIGATLDQAEAISAIPQLFDDPAARQLLSLDIKDVLVERSQATFNNLAQDIDFKDGVWVYWSLRNGIRSLQSARNAIKAKRLEKIIDKIATLEISDPSKEAEIDKLVPLLSKSNSLTPKLRNVINYLASVGTEKAWQLAVEFTSLHYDLYVRKPSAAHLFRSLGIKNKKEYLACMLAPTILSHHGDRVF